MSHFCTVLYDCESFYNVFATLEDGAGMIFHHPAVSPINHSGWIFKTNESEYDENGDGAREMRQAEDRKKDADRTCTCDTI